VAVPTTQPSQTTTALPRATAGGRRGLAGARRLAGRLAGDQLSVLLALSVMGLAPRLYEIGRRSFWFDELISMGIAALDLPTFLVALTVEANMTLYYWALFGWVRLVGVGADEATIRLLSVVVSAPAIPLTYWLGRRLHSPAVGLMAAGLLSVHAYHASQSQEARSVGLFCTLTVLSYVLLDRALERGRARDWAWYGVVVALAFYSHFYAVLTILAQALFVVSRRSRAAFRGLVLAGLVAAVLLAQLAPYFYWAIFFVEHGHLVTLFHLTPPGWSDVADFLLRYGGMSYGLLGLYGVFWAFGCLRGARGERSAGYRTWLLLSWFFVPVLLALGISQLKPMFDDRYLLQTLPALPLLAAVGLASLPRPSRVAAFCLFAGFSTWVLASHMPERWEQEWRQTARYALGRARPDDGWIFISKMGQDAFEYYGGWHWKRNPAAPYQHILEPIDWRQAAAVADYLAVTSTDELERFAAAHPRIWLVQANDTDRQSDTQRSKPTRSWLTQNGYRGAEQGDFNGIRLVLYQRR
jgi:mannosyltransferase